MKVTFKPFKIATTRELYVKSEEALRIAREIKADDGYCSGDACCDCPFREFCGNEVSSSNFRKELREFVMNRVKLPEL